MNLALILFSGFVAVLLLALAWALRKPRDARNLKSGPQALEQGQRHVDYLPQIRQALAKTDYDFLSRRASRDAQRRVQRDRRGIALAYLAALRGDFQGLLRMARVIAVLSPDVAAAHEFERLRLTAKFAWQYQMIRWKLMAGFAPLPQLDGLSALVSGLSVRMEVALKELGERAALTAELTSSMNRRGLSAV